MKIFELSPINGRKSFGGKCKVILENNVAKLLSYNTIIGEFNTLSNEYKQVFDGEISKTTSSHIKSFKQFYNIQN